ncbi:hypothetical protein [Sinorhizobium medicae]|uniref:hypothetical protein n=1 Tax=Sinorhizobium medicae TaxID=110321 RepID=UPI00307D0AAF
MDIGQPHHSVDLEAPGSILNPASVGCPIILETVPGAWSERVVRGDPELETAYVAAAQRLVERGASAIGSDCGFTIRHQAAVAASIDVPVAMSSLLLLPTLLRQLPPCAKIAVLTFDSTSCTDDLLGLDDPDDRARVVFGGIEGSTYWYDELKYPTHPTDVTAMEADVGECIMRLRATYPEIRAILFECAGFPLVASAIRHLTKLPVYDITGLCRLMIASLD